MALFITDQLAAIAAAERAGYTFNASDLISATTDASGVAWYTFEGGDGYLYYVSEEGVVESNAPWQMRVG